MLAGCRTSRVRRLDPSHPQPSIRKLLFPSNFTCRSSSVSFMAASGANPESLLLTRGSTTRSAVPSAPFVSVGRRKGCLHPSERLHATGPRGTIRDRDRISKSRRTHRRRSASLASSKEEDAIEQLRRDRIIPQNATVKLLFREIQCPLLELFASLCSNMYVSGKDFPSQEESLGISTDPGTEPYRGPISDGSSADPESPTHPGTTKASLPAPKLLSSTIGSVTSSNRPSCRTIEGVERRFPGRGLSDRFLDHTSSYTRECLARERGVEERRAVELVLAR